MPGVDYHGKSFGFPDPPILPFPLCKSLTGTGTPPAAALKAGDLVVLTQKTGILPATATAGLRMLLGADKTAHYKEGTPVAGILGLLTDGVTTDGSAPPVAGPETRPGGPGSFAYQFSNAQLWGMDSSGLAEGKVMVAAAGVRFKARLDINATDFTGAITINHQLDETLAGLAISVSSGVTTYRVQAGTGTSFVNGGTGAAALDSCIIIIGPDTSDPLYNTAITASGAVGSGAQGPYMIFEVIPSFCQGQTGVYYTAN